MTLPKAKTANTKKPLTSWVDMQCGNESVVRFYCRKCSESLWIGKTGFSKFIRIVIHWDSLHQHPEQSPEKNK